MMAGTKVGWSLVAVVLIVLLSISTYFGYSAYRLRQANEMMVRRLVGEFHEHFNPQESDEPDEYFYDKIEFERLWTLQAKLGNFQKVESCKITSYIEPPSFRADCLSQFSRAKARETFVFRDLGLECKLVSYSATTIPDVTSDTEQTSK